ncbi:MAG: 16S rRNA (cytosine(967)-C(5))-methyltransferase RsmB [Pseudomonadales bacterium]
MAQDARADAALKLTEIIVRERTTDQVFDSSSPASPLVTELVYGTLRHYMALAHVVREQLQKPLRNSDMDVFHLMMIGLYQRHFTRIPDHAAVNETVAAAKHLKKPWARGLINAVLRRAPNPEPSFEHPDWFQDELTSCVKAQAPSILAANLERAPMAIRINLEQISRTDYLGKLKATGIGVHDPIADTIAGDERSGWGPETLILKTPVPSRVLPGFNEGLVSIQDGGAQLLPGILFPESCTPMSTLLDACAAPGGKLFHLLERFPGLRVTALDRSSRRMDMLTQESRRLKAPAFTSIVADAIADTWWDGTLFDNILLDAPCSGSGTIRRHPEIKLLRQRKSLPVYAETQTQLLKMLWAKLKPGGVLVYCTCSLFEVENDGVIGRFLQEQTDARLQPLSVCTGVKTAFGWQLLPTNPQTDGFYFSRLTKADP